MKSDSDVPRGMSGKNMTIQAAAPEPRDTRFGGAQANRSHRGGGAIRVHCPHCESLAKVRTTREVTALYRELRFQCMNVDGDEPCGHTFVASLVIERTIVASARPNPRIRLPIAAPRIRRMPSGQPAAAND
ncbi:DNA-binding transcriptional regulator [compost metagenome]